MNNNGIISTVKITQCDLQPLRSHVMGNPPADKPTPELRLVTNTYYPNGSYSFVWNGWQIMDAEIVSMTCDSSARRFEYRVQPGYKAQNND